MSDDLDWTLLEDYPDVIEMCERAARRVCDDYDDLALNDLIQEAVLALVTNAESLRPWLDSGDQGLVFHRIYCDLVDIARRETKKTDQNVVLVEDQLADEATLDWDAPVIGNGQSVYTRDLVETLCPAIWDDDCMLGMIDPYGADRDMPKAIRDKKVGPNLWAHIADIRSSWQYAPLTWRQRQAVFLRFALDYTDATAGALVGVSGQAMGVRKDAGVGHLTAWLNGTKHVDVPDEDVMV